MILPSDISSMAKTVTPLDGNELLGLPIDLNRGRPVIAGQPVGQMTAGATLHMRQNDMHRTMKVLHLGALTAAAALYVASTTDAAAQNARNCGPREAVVDRLAEGYGETRQSIGLGANNSVVEVFASRETGSWTITVTTPNGLTCLVASGQSFETLAEALPEKGKEDA